MHPFQISSIVSIMSFIAKESNPRITYCIEFSCLFSLLHSGVFPKSFLDFHDIDLTVWNFTDESVFRMSFKLGLSDIWFVWTQLWWLCSSHYLPSSGTWLQFAYIHFDHFPAFPMKSCSFPFVINVYFVGRYIKTT